MATSGQTKPRGHHGRELFDPEAMFADWKGNYGKRIKTTIGEPSVETSLNEKRKGIP